MIANFRRHKSLSVDLLHSCIFSNAIELTSHFLFAVEDEIDPKFELASCVGRTTACELCEFVGGRVATLAGGISSAGVYANF